MIKKSQGYKGKIDLNVCIFCREPVDNFSRTTDHLHPESRGGIRSKDNSAPSCQDCNMLKGDMTVEEFKKFLEKIIGIEFKNTKEKTGYYKKVAISCKYIIDNSVPRDIIINSGPDAKDN
jgi:hypothetical protein